MRCCVYPYKQRTAPNARSQRACYCNRGGMDGERDAQLRGQLMHTPLTHRRCSSECCSRVVVALIALRAGGASRRAYRGLTRGIPSCRLLNKISKLPTTTTKFRILRSICDLLVTRT